MVDLGDSIHEKQNYKMNERWIEHFIAFVLCLFNNKIYNDVYFLMFISLVKLIDEHPAFTSIE